MAVTGIRTGMPPGSDPEVAPHARRRAPANSAGDETRARIIEACRRTLHAEGITGASARTIARAGAFNQALIFYHFGSVEGLLIATAASEGEARSKRYEERFADVTTLPQLVTVARAVHLEEQAEGSVNVLTQLLAGTNASPALRQGILDAMRPWMVLVEDALNRVLCGSTLQSFVETSELTFAVSAFFLGIELLTGLDPTGARADSLFASIETSSTLLQTLLTATRNVNT